MTFSDKDYALYEAAGSFGVLLAKRTKEIEDFKLYAPVMEYIGGKVGMQLGKKEGIKFLCIKSKLYGFNQECP